MRKVKSAHVKHAVKYKAPSKAMIEEYNLNAITRLTGTTYQTGPRRGQELAEFIQDDKFIATVFKRVYPPEASTD